MKPIDKKTMKKITNAEVGPMPRPMPEGMFDPMPSVKVTYDDGTEETLFRAPDDWIMVESDYQAAEIRALALRHGKDVKYLRP